MRWNECYKLLWPQFCYTNVFIFLGKIKFIHQGHCAAGSGWIWPNSKQETIDGCLKECKSRAANAKYFAYSPGKQGCACYKTDCKYDGRKLDYKSYEILQPGHKIFQSYLFGIG